MQTSNPATDSPRSTTLLVGVDGSGASAAAMRWAVAQAKALDAQIVAAYVMTVDTEFLHDMAPAGFTNWRRKIDEHMHGPWTEVARSAGVPIRARIIQDDDQAMGLVHLADEVDAVMVVVGMHSRGELADRLLGSTTYKLSHRSTRPLVIIPADWNVPTRS